MKKTPSTFQLKLLPLILISMLLGACGGGGGGGSGGNNNTPPPVVAASAEGVYNGQLTGGNSKEFTSLVLENDEIWTIFGTTTNNVFIVSGFLQGSGTSNNGSFTSSDAKDFGVAPAISSPVTATYNSVTKTITGVVVEGAATVTFSGAQSTSSPYQYSTPAQLSTISGLWSATTLAHEALDIQVSANGMFAAASALGCGFSGTILPRASGKNVFDVSLTFGGAPCILPGQSGSGIAIAYKLVSGKTQLLVAVHDSSRTYGMVALGQR